jgi:hypothetical protein
VRDFRADTPRGSGNNDDFIQKIKYLHDYLAIASKWVNTRGDYAVFLLAVTLRCCQNTALPPKNTTTGEYAAEL